MSETLLMAEGLCMRFGGVVAVNGVDLTLAAGELRCIIGPNGAGKSTLFNMLSGTQRPVEGSIRFEGRNLVGLPSHAFARAGIARKFQVPSLFGNLSVRDNLDVASRSHRSDLARAARVSEIMDSLGLGADAELRAEELSHGRKQWLEIGMTMMTQPRLLLLDEPTAGMTAEETQSTVHLVRRLSGEMGIIVIEHDMTFVRSLAAPTLVMHQGRIIAAGDFATIEQNPLVRNVYLGRQ